MQHGRFDDISGVEGPFGRLWAECENAEEEEDSEDVPESEYITPDEQNAEEKNEKKVDRANSRFSEKLENGTDKKKPDNQEKLEMGRVKKSVYALYIRTMGLCNSLLFLVFFVFHYSVMIMRSLWLSDWSNSNAEIKKNGGNSTMSVNTRLIVYAGFGGIESESP